MEGAETMYSMRRGSVDTRRGVIAHSLPFHRGAEISSEANVPPANSGSYFRATLQLSVITQHILTSLYSPSTILRAPGYIQQETITLAERLDAWVCSLPIDFNPREQPSPSIQSFARERTILGFQFRSARMLLTRPFLGKQRQSWKDSREGDFAGRMACMCIEAATSVITSLPDTPDPKLIHDQGPWWCIVHHLMQAISVLLLGLSLSSSSAEDNAKMVYQVQKAMRWLQVIRTPVADRAYCIAHNLLRAIDRRDYEGSSNLWTAKATDAMAERAGLMQQAAPDVVLEAYYPPNMATAPIPMLTMPMHTVHGIMTAGNNHDTQVPVPTSLFDKEYYMT